MKIRWWEGFERTQQNVVAGWMDLSEEDAYDNAVLLTVPRHCDQCQEPIPMGEKAPEKCPVCHADIPTLGEELLGNETMLYTKMRFENRMRDYEGRSWKWAIFLHYFPKDQTFKKIPGLWFSHKGLMFRTSTGSIDVTYIGFKEEIHHVKYFLVTSSPARTRRIQMGLGMTPATATLDQLNNARKLSSIRVGIEELTKRQEAESQADLSFETMIDSKTRAYEGADRVLDDMEGMRERRSTSGNLKQNWKRYLVYALIAVAVVWFVWSTGVFGGSPPPELPPLNITETGG